MKKNRSRTKTSATAVEFDPLGKDQHQAGAKMDGGKAMAGVIADFGMALMKVAEVGTFGVKKYTRGGWQHVDDGMVRYNDAKWRHLLRESSNPIDEESGILTKAHTAWNALAELELILREATK